MNLIIEALFVGFYTSIFELIPMIGNVYIYLFIIGLHNYYCNNDKNNINDHIIKESILECYVSL
jgi:hypothetical protein